MLRSESEPTDPLEQHIAEIGEPTAIATGLVGLLLGLWLLRTVRRWVLDPSQPVLVPPPLTDASVVLLLTLGAFLVTQVGAGVVVSAVGPGGGTEANETATDEPVAGSESDLAGEEATGEEEAGVTPDEKAPEAAPERTPRAAGEPAAEDAGEERVDPLLVRAWMLAGAVAMVITSLVAVATARWSGSGAAKISFGLDRAPLGFARGLLFYVAVFPAFIGASYLSAGVQGLFGRTPVPQQAVESLNELGADPALLLTAGLIIPVCEEIFFRGVLLVFMLRICLEFSGRGQRVLGHPAVAIVLNAALFAMIHDQGWAPIFAIGLVLAWLTWRTGNLLASIVLHVSHNCFVSLVVISS